MAQDNWLSTDAMIAEVCDDAVANYGGSSILSIRCPDKEIQKKVRAYLDKKRGGKTIDTYVGALHDSVKTIYHDGDNTPVEKAPRSKRKPAGEEPLSMDEALLADGEKLMAMTDEDHGPFDLSGLVGDDPDLGGLV